MKTRQKGELYQEGIQHCKNCNEETLHIPKMDAVKNGQRVCSKCRCCNFYYETLNRCDECGGYMIEKRQTQADSSGAREVFYYECPNCHE